MLGVIFGLILFFMWLMVRGDETDPSALLDNVGTSISLPEPVAPIEEPVAPEEPGDSGIDPELLAQADKIIEEANAASPDDPHVDPLEGVGIEPTQPTTPPAPAPPPTPAPAPPEGGSWGQDAEPRQSKEDHRGCPNWIRRSFQAGQAGPTPVTRSPRYRRAHALESVKSQVRIGSWDCPSMASPAFPKSDSHSCWVRSRPPSARANISTSTAVAKLSRMAGSST